ncbi:MAG TPA: carboxy-S-adenosyl-L-methionine synthase CmoA [Pseudomonadales bacterium]|nr:carboxy-S-adenosyl-L-methionine synthase CmoA [Pseudomonadales bacterium]
MRDEVYRRPREQIVDFVFDDAVAAAFSDMIRRSVPGYETVVPLSGLIAARHARAGSVCYDLGCSLGATAIAIARQLTVPNCRIVAVDNSSAMLERAKSLHDEPRIDWVCADLRDVAFDMASAVTMNYTLQFVPSEDRLPLLARIRRALDPDGVLIVSEKVQFADAAEHDYFDATHAAYKRANGYSELEVAQKRAALEQVLIPDRIEDHEARFRAAGFTRSRIWFRCLNWVSFAAMP